MTKRKKTSSPPSTEAQALIDEFECQQNPLRRLDPAILRAYDAYFKDWRWNMATLLQVQREYMPVSRRIQ